MKFYNFLILAVFEPYFISLLESATLRLLQWARCTIHVKTVRTLGLIIFYIKAISCLWVVLRLCWLASRYPLVMSQNKSETQDHRVRQLCHFTITKTETQDKLMWLYDWATAKRCLKFNLNVNFYVCSGQVEWIFKFLLNSRSVLFVRIYNEW